MISVNEFKIKLKTWALAVTSGKHHGQSNLMSVVRHLRTGGASRGGIDGVYTLDNYDVERIDKIYRSLDSDHRTVIRVTYLERRSELFGSSEDMLTTERIRARKAGMFLRAYRQTLEEAENIMRTLYNEG